MVSVIIAVYNGEKFIKDAIESLINQTYKDIEIIAVDDGSTDNTKNIIKNYKNIKYIYEKNKGPAAARNKGIENSNGDYIAFLDADDLYVNDKIEKQLKVLQKNNECDVIYNNLRVVDENLNYINTLKSERVYKSRENMLANVLYRQVVQGPVCIMMRRKCIYTVKWNENLKYVNDYDYIINLLKNFKFKYIDEELYVYRRHNNNFSNNHKETLKEEASYIKSIGINNIKEIINKTDYNESEKSSLLSKIYIKIGEYKKAHKVLRDIVCESKSPVIYFYLGLCSYMMHEINEAIEYYNKSINGNYSMAESYNNLGCCYFKQDKNKALLYFEKAVKIRKSYMDAEKNINSVKNNNDKCFVTMKELRKVLTMYNYSRM